MFFFRKWKGFIVLCCLRVVKLLDMTLPDYPISFAIRICKEGTDINLWRSNPGYNLESGLKNSESMIELEYG